MKHVKLFEQFLNEMVESYASAKKQLAQLPYNTSKDTLKAIKAWLKKGTLVEEESIYSDPENYTKDEIQAAMDKVSKIKSIKKVELGFTGGIFAEDENGALYDFKVDFVKSGKTGWMSVLRTPGGFKQGAGKAAVTTSGTRTTYTYSSDMATLSAQSNTEEFIEKVKEIAGLE